MMSDIYERIAIYCEENSLFEPGDGVVAGLSGGADSVLLLYVLKKLQEKWGLRLCAVHVHHGIRAQEADRDMEYAQSFAEKLGVECRIYHGNVPLLAEEWHMSEEEAGRAYRYQCFEECCSMMGFQKIAVAHHENDQAETLLFQMLRGSSLRGMGGMLPKRGRVVRPLLGISRREIEEVLDREKIPYCTDGTNLENTYTRNILRNQVIPYLQREIQPEAAAHMAHTAKHLQEVMEYVDAQTADAYERLVCREEQKIRMNQIEYRKLHKVIQRELIMRMIQEAAGRRKDITSVHIGIVQEIFAGGTGRTANLPYGLRACCSYETVWIEWGKEGQKEPCTPFEQKILTDREYTISFGDGELRRVFFEETDGEKISMEDLKKHCTKCFDYDRMVTMPSFRYAQEGDYLWLDREGKTKKLSRLFIDEKIPVSRRKGIMVLAEGHHILWVPALERCSAYYYISAETKKILYAHIYE